MAVFAPLATLNVKDHTLAVDIPDFQVRQLGTPQASWRRESSAEFDETGCSQHR
jgi:hypothetical protein